MKAKALDYLLQNIKNEGCNEEVKDMSELYFYGGLHIPIVLFLLYFYFHTN